MNINVSVTDANNIVCNVTATPTQTITIDRGVAGNGIVSVSVVTISGDQYLRIVFTNGTTSDVGPISATYYTGTSPINVNNTTNVISLGVVPVLLGGTGVTTSTGTGNTVLSASPTFSGTITASAISASSTITGNGNWVIGNADTDTITQGASYVTGTKLRSAKVATNTLALSAYDVDGLVYTDLVTLTASNTPTLTLTSTGVGTLNNISVGATTPSSGAFTTLTASTAIGIASGGTGQGTANAAFNALAPSQVGNSGKYLTTDGTDTSWAANPLGTVTSVGGTGTVSGITLSGTVTTSGNLSLGGTLDLSSPPSIGNTSANTGAFTTLSASGAVTLSGGTANGIAYLNGSSVVTTGTAFAFDGTSVTASQFLDTGFTLADNTDITKKAAFELSGLTTATTRTYTLPDVTGTVALTSGVQTFSSSTTFSGTTINITATTQALNLGSSNTSGVLTLGGTSGTGIITLGRSTVSQTTNIQAGATASGSVKTINFGTAGLSGSTTTINIGSAVAGATSNITLSGIATMSGPVINNGYTEQVFAVTGTTPALSPTNGSIQTWTLSGNSTPTAGTWANGQSLTLMVDDGTAFTITWTSLAVTWETNAGTAPTLSTTGYTAIQFWKVGGVIYGARVGDA